MIKIKEENVIYRYSEETGQIEEENRILRESIAQLRTEIERFRKVPLMVCELKDMVGRNAVIRVPNGNQFFVEVASGCENLKPGDSVLVEQKNLTVVRKIKTAKRFNSERLIITERPNVTWKDIGGLEEQIREMQEVIELPLKKPELFQKVGIQPPKGLLLHGHPGTGKTLLAKAVASSTNAAFIEVVGSELVQKFIGEGAKQVKEIFQTAREKAPAIIFIDELDALAAKRIETGTSGEREVHRTFMQLLSEIDGFKRLGNVKVIGCTNRKDILDPAIMRPGRLERQIHMPLPDSRARHEIFKIHTKDMSIERVNCGKLIGLMENFTGAEIKSAATEAGYFAIRSGRTTVTQQDFIAAIQKLRRKETEEGKEHLKMFG